MAAPDVVHLWKQWGLHVLVLLSFMLQVVLLVLAELQRRIDPDVLRASTYMLADSAVIYAISYLRRCQSVAHALAYTYVS
ncbi:unnamed protein product [Urochloa humidicola]